MCSQKSLLMAMSAVEPGGARRGLAGPDWTGLGRAEPDRTDWRGRAEPGGAGREQAGPSGAGLDRTGPG